MTGRCVEASKARQPFKPSRTCKYNSQCREGKFCHNLKSICTPFGRKGEACSPQEPCGDGLSCSKGVCVRRCHRDGDCSPVDRCLPIPGDIHKGCLSRQNLAPAKPPAGSDQPLDHVPMIIAIAGIIVMLFIAGIGWAMAIKFRRRMEQLVQKGQQETSAIQTYPSAPSPMIASPSQQHPSTPAYGGPPPAYADSIALPLPEPERKGPPSP